MFDWYLPLAESIRAAGFFTNGVENKGDWSRTTVCSMELPGGIGYGGNSFWVTRLEGKWYLGTWGGCLYRLPESERIVELCVEWLALVPRSTIADFDADLKSKFGLEEIDESEFDEAIGRQSPK